MNQTIAAKNSESVTDKTAFPDGMSSSTSVYTTGAFWERLWRKSGITYVALYILGCVIHGYHPGVGASVDALAAFYGGHRTRILRSGALWPERPEPPVVRGGSEIHPGEREARRLGRGSDRLQRCARGALLPSHHGGRNPRLLNRRLWKSRARIRAERLWVGSHCVEFVSTRDAHHGGQLRTLARRAGFECALCGGCRGNRAGLAWRYHVAERWILGTGRGLFTVRLADHRSRVGHGSEPGPFDPKSG